MASPALPLSSIFQNGGGPLPYIGGAQPIFDTGGVPTPNPVLGGFNQPGGVQGGPIMFNGGPITVANGNPAQATVPSVPPSTSATTLGSMLTPFTQWNTPFVPPSADQAAQTPGEQFALQQGIQALDNSAAARGTLLTGGTGKALEQYGQGLASTNYQQAYNNALTNFQTNYNLFQNNQANEFNRLASLAGFGQTAAGNLNAAGSNAANNFSNILLGSGSQIGGDLQNAASALASGQVGSANAISGGLSSLTSLGSLLPFLTQQNSSVLSNNGASIPGGAGPGTTIIP